MLEKRGDTLRAAAARRRFLLGAGRRAVGADRHRFTVEPRRRVTRRPDRRVPAAGGTGHGRRRDGGGQPLRRTGRRPPQRVLARRRSSACSSADLVWPIASWWARAGSARDHWSRSTGPTTPMRSRRRSGWMAGAVGRYTVSGQWIEDSALALPVRYWVGQTFSTSSIAARLFVSDNLPQVPTTVSQPQVVAAISTLRAQPSRLLVLGEPVSGPPRTPGRADRAYVREPGCCCRPGLVRRRHSAAAGPRLGLGLGPVLRQSAASHRTRRGRSGCRTRHPTLNRPSRWPAR